MQALEFISTTVYANVHFSRQAATLATLTHVCSCIEQAWNVEGCCMQIIRYAQTLYVDTSLALLTFQKFTACGLPHLLPMDRGQGVHTSLVHAPAFQRYI